jgi:hypothetical protein
MRALILIIILFGIVSGYLILVGISGIFHIRLIDSVRFQLPLQDTIGRHWTSYSVSFISHALVPHPPACTPGTSEFNMVNEVSQFHDPCLGNGIGRFLFLICVIILGVVSVGPFGE